MAGKPPNSPKALTDLPKASEDAIDFLDNISLDMLNPIVGKDELDYYSASDADNNEVGHYSFQLQITSRNLKPLIKIIVNIKYTMNDILRSTDIISNLTLQAKLVEQHYEKHIKAKYHLLRELNVVLQEDGLVFNQNHFIDGKINMQTTYMILTQDLGGFIPSVFNVLLLKLFARIGGVPNNQMTFIGQDADYFICPIVYINLPKTKLSVHDEWVDTITIEKRVIGKHENEITRYFLDESGNLLLVVRLNQDMYALATGVKHTRIILESVFEDHKARKKFEWEKDLEMISKFQYLKEKMKGELLKYHYKNPFWMSIIADFLQQLLIDKPDDVLGYMSTYFLDHSSSLSQSIGADTQSHVVTNK